MRGGYWHTKTVESKDLEHTVWKAFNSIGFNIGEDRIEACHQLTKSDHTIVKERLWTFDAY